MKILIQQWAMRATIRGEDKRSLPMANQDNSFNQHMLSSSSRRNQTHTHICGLFKEICAIYVLLLLIKQPRFKKVRLDIRLLQ